MSNGKYTAYKDGKLMTDEYGNVLEFSDIMKVHIHCCDDALKTESYNSKYEVVSPIVLKTILVNFELGL